MIWPFLSLWRANRVAIYVVAAELQLHSFYCNFQRIMSESEGKVHRWGNWSTSSLGASVKKNLVKNAYNLVFTHSSAVTQCIHLEWIKVFWAFSQLDLCLRTLWGAVIIMHGDNSSTPQKSRVFPLFFTFCFNVGRISYNSLSSLDK